MQEIKKWWKKVKLGDVINTKKWYAFKSSWFWKWNHPVIKVSDFTMSSISNEKINYVSDELFFENEKHKVLEKDILIQTVGSWPSAPLSVVWKVVRVPSYLNNALLNQNIVKIFPNINLLDNDFLFYMLKSSDFKWYIEWWAQGAASQASITLKHIINFSFFLPPLLTQQKIASVLSKYDDLIENNNKRIKILKETAQAIYEEWFVKYNFPWSENIKMVDSWNDDFGMIPEGWEIWKIKDFWDVITWKTPSKSKEENYWDYMSFIKTPDLHWNFYCLNTNENLSEIWVSTQKNKIIPKDSLVVSCIWTVWVVWITSGDSQTNQQINSIVLNNSNNLEYLFFLLRDLKPYLEKLWANWATLLNVNKEKFSNVKVLFPKQDILIKYSEIVKPSFEKILNLQKQNQNLKETRDLLIPRLVSGELDIESLDVK